MFKNQLYSLFLLFSLVSVHNISVASDDCDAYYELLDVVEYGSIKELRDLLQSGIPVDAADEQGYTALFTACGSARIDGFLGEDGNFYLIDTGIGRDLEKIELLLNYGAHINHRCTDNRCPGMTPLFEACGLGCVGIIKADLKVVRFLLEHGAHVNQIADSGLSPLLLAACNQDVELIHLLIQYGARKDLAIKESQKLLMDDACVDDITTAIQFLNSIIS